MQLSPPFLDGMHWAGLSDLGKSIHSHTVLFKFKNVSAAYVLLSCKCKYDTSRVG